MKELMKERFPLILPLFVPAIMYMGLVVAAIKFLETNPASAWRYAVALAPLVPGFFLLAGGIILGIIVVEIYSRSLTLAVGYAMVSVLLTIVGTLLMSTGITLHSVRALLIDFNTSSKK